MLQLEFISLHCINHIVNQNKSATLTIFCIESEDFLDLKSPVIFV